MNMPQKKNTMSFPSRGRPSASRVPERDEILLDTASRLFLEHGYGKVSIDQVARSAGVATRTIYTRFGGKKGLLKKLVERDGERARARLAKIIAMHDNTETSLRELALLFFERALMPASHLMYCDVLAERDFELASQMDLMHDGSWRQLIESVLSLGSWRSICTSHCSPSILRDLFIGCVTSTKCESANTTTYSGSVGQDTMRLANDATQRFLTALS